MSEPLAESSPSDLVNENVTQTVPAETGSGKSSEDSSVDSEGSSGSSSGEESSDSGSTSGSDQASEGTAHKLDQSDDHQSGTDQDDQLIDESFKTVNTTLKVDDDDVTSPELNVTPVRAEHVGLAVGPAVAQVSTQLPVASVGGPASAKVPDQSPVPVTPAKQMEWGDVLNAIEAPLKAPCGKDGVFLTPRGPGNSPFSPGQLFSPPSVPVANKTVQDLVQVGAELSEKLYPAVVVHESPAVQTKDAKDSGTKKSRRRKDRAVKKVEQDVRQLQLEIDEIRNLKAKAKLDAKKRRLLMDKRQKKAKKRKPPSSGELESSESSSPDAPSTSNRISRIPNGRKYQRIAMSRSKQLGVIVLNDNRAAGVSAAAKLVNQAEFKILPIHAYPSYHQVPGTGLPHIRKLIRDVQMRYAPFLKATAELHLGLAMEYRLSRNRLVVPDEASSFTSIWRMENDLTRVSDKPEEEIGQLKSAQFNPDVGTSNAPAPSLAVVVAPVPSQPEKLKAPELAIVADKVPKAVRVVVEPKNKPAKKKKKDSKGTKVKQEVEFLNLINYLINLICILLPADCLWTTVRARTLSS